MIGGVSRRGVLATVGALGLAGVARAQGASGPTAGGPTANGPTVGDPTVGETRITTAGGDIAGTFGRPVGSGPFPVVLLAENGTGLDQVVANACRGLATEGFLAIAPALFAGDPPDGTAFARLDDATKWAAANGGDVSRLGAVGFGHGGRAVWLYDAYSPALKAVVAWDVPMGGKTSPAHPQTPSEVAGQLHAPLLGLFGKDNGPPKQMLLDVESKAKAAGRVAEIVQYVNAGRNFGVAGAPGFDQAATLDGWKRTLAWLRGHGVG